MSGTRWIPWDVGYYHNPKARAAGKNGRALHHASSCFAADNWTDGKILPSDVPLLLAEAEVPRSTVTTLVNLGMWIPQPDGGWLIHDFLKHNKSRSQMEEERAKWARQKAGQRGMSTADTGVESTASPPTKTDRQTDIRSACISENDDSEMTGDEMSSGRRQARLLLATRAAHALAERSQTRTKPVEAYAAGIVPKLLAERLDDIDRCIDRDLSADAVLEILTSTPAPPPCPQRREPTSDPDCPRCAGSGFATILNENGDPTNDVFACDCEPPIAPVHQLRRGSA